MWGYCDKNKKIVIPVCFLEARPFNHNFALVMTTNKYFNIINKSGQKLLSSNMQINDFFDDNYIIVTDKKNQLKNYGPK